MITVTFHVRSHSLSSLSLSLFFSLPNAVLCLFAYIFSLLLFYGSFQIYRLHCSPQSPPPRGRHANRDSSFVGKENQFFLLLQLFSCSCCACAYVLLLFVCERGHNTSTPLCLQRKRARFLRVLMNRLISKRPRLLARHPGALGNYSFEVLRQEQQQQQQEQ